ncbi:MAG: trimethylamine methyltransferase family protein [Candidatus Promineifilaceae bacterium]|nr:trimethylamine methyltransferase family protein [Candidatus Promineifilaceae bacterium]
MIQPGFRENRSVDFQVLSDDQIAEIRRAAFEVLEKVGCQLLHAEARQMLAQAGAQVEGDRVKIPEYIVAECLRQTPKGFTIYDRDGRRALEVEGRKSYYGTSTASPNTRDIYSGEIRETRVADIALGARVADGLENIDWVMPMGSSQDVSPDAADVYEFEAVVNNTAKPIVFIGYSPRGVELVLEMAAVVAGGADALRQRPFLMLYPEPISPLVFTEDVVGRMFVAADMGIPQIPGTAVQPGATAPVTMAGAIVQGLAEGLMSLVLIQLRRPGTPCTLSVNVGIFDMATTQMCMAAPETSLALAAHAEVARSFGLPTWGLAGATDAKRIDAQAGLESAFAILAQGLAGLNLIHDVGYLDMGMACSAEMLVMGDEIIAMTKRFIRGVEVNADTLAREVIARVGPGGHFLEDDHTYAHFRQELWMPTLLTRRPRDEWQRAGAKDMGQRVRDKTIGLAESHSGPPLADELKAKLADMRARGATELAGQTTA